MVTRSGAGSFADHHVHLMKTFADQAVIAIENVAAVRRGAGKTRDLTEALTYQTGTANILSVIISSPTDVGPVLKTILESASSLRCLCAAVVGCREDDEYLRVSAHHGPIPIGIEKWQINRARPPAAPSSTGRRFTLQV